MKKKQANKNNQTKAQPQAAQTSGFWLWLIKNAAAACLAGVLLSECIEQQQGYNWAYNSLLKGNMEIIRANPKLTTDRKNEMKLGFDYAYLRFLKSKTPENAVILYPSPGDFFPEGAESPFKQDISGKIWALRFLYPRKLVLPHEMETNRYAKEITHVAIVNGRGYERLNYEAERLAEHDVLPMKR